MKKTILVLFAILLAGPAMGATGSHSGTKLFFSAGVKAGYGNMRSVDGTTVVSRGFGVYSLDSDLGLSLGGLELGAGLDYGMWRQLKKPAEVGNSNTQGTALNFGPMIGYRAGPIEVVGRYYLKSTYALDKADSSGRALRYLDPKSAFAFQLKFPFGSGVPYMGFEYKTVTYQKTEIAGQEYILAEPNQIKTSTFGLLVGFAY